MKLSFLDPHSRAAVNISRLKRCGYDTRRIIAGFSRTLDGLVVLGNGTPDDKVLGVLSYHLDGEKIIGVVKPGERTKEGVLLDLRKYIGLRKIMILIDQDDRPLSKIYEQVIRIMQKIGMAANEEPSNLERFRIYHCHFSGKEFEIIIVINGLDEIHTAKHTIEDHLVKAAGIEISCSSKEAWNRLSKNEQENIFRRLKGDRRRIESLFPQQVAGCKRLKESL